MEIINLNKAGSSHSMHSWPDHLAVPDGWAIVSEGLDKSVFYEHNGFVTLTTEEQERVTGTHEEPREVTKDLSETPIIGENGELIYSVTETVYETVEDTATVTVVTAWEPDLEAWEAWKAGLPEPVAPAPTPAERIAALERENALLNQQVVALSDQNDFQEELIVELANIVYA